MTKRLRITLLTGLVAMACAGPRAEHVEFVSKADVPVTLTAQDVTDSVNVWIAYRRDFDLQEVPASVPSRIAVDSKYWLWVNGDLVRRGTEAGAEPEGQLFR